MVLQENIELKNTKKIQLKTISAQKVTHMKDLILSEAHIIINNDYTVPRTPREEEENRASLIIKIDDDFKEEIKTFCDVHSVRIRDFWVECVERIIRGYNDGKTKTNKS